MSDGPLSRLIRPGLGALAITLLLVVLLTLLPRGIPANDEPPVVETQGATAKALVAMLSSQFTSIERTGDSVAITSSRSMSRGSEFEHAITLRVGQGFSLPDKHEQQTYILKEMTPSGIRLDYSLRFDHRDFGLNKITHDVGTIEVPWHPAPLHHP